MYINIQKSRDRSKYNMILLSFCGTFTFSKWNAWSIWIENEVKSTYLSLLSKLIIFIFLSYSQFWGEVKNHSIHWHKTEKHVKLLQCVKLPVSFIGAWWNSCARIKSSPDVCGNTWGGNQYKPYSVIPINQMFEFILIMQYYIIVSVMCSCQ